MAEMIEVQGLSKSFGGYSAVENISLSVSKGEVLGFLGPNGAGKTTTMRMIAGFLIPSSGTVRVCGHDVVVEPVKVKSVIGYLPEGSPSYDDMTVGAFLKFIAEIRGFRGVDKDARVRAVAERIALTEVLDQPIEVLSKGFRRRVGLAQSIIHDPPVLILDEPTDSLDPNQKHHVRNLISNMAAEKAIIISTHILEEVETVCSRAVIIGQGRVLADGTSVTLRAQTASNPVVVVTVPRADAAAAQACFRALPQVPEISESIGPDERATLRVTSSGVSDLLEAVAAAVRQNNIPAIEIFQERDSLDDVFRHITTKRVAV